MNEGFKKPQLLLKHNVRIKSSARNGHCLPWHKLKDGDATDAQMQQWWRDTAWPTRFWFWCDVWGRRDQRSVLCIPSLAVCSTRCSQPDLNLANWEVTVAAKWTLAFQELHGSASILMTSTYVIITLCCASSDGIFYNFLVTSNVKMNCARSYESLLNFVKVMLNIPAVPFFPDTVYLNLHEISDTVRYIIINLALQSLRRPTTRMCLPENDWHRNSTYLRRVYR